MVWYNKWKLIIGYEQQTCLTVFVGVGSDKFGSISDTYLPLKQSEFLALA